CIVFAECFFSSRRRHTRFSRDWSSDVCSSDLGDMDGYAAVKKRIFQHQQETGVAIINIDDARCEHIATSLAIHGNGRVIPISTRSEEHTSELQSREKLVCRLLLENKKIAQKHV